MNQRLNTAEPPFKTTTEKTLNTIDVQIIDSSGHVDQKNVEVSRGNYEEVRWHAHKHEDAKIVFAGPQGSPFDEVIFFVPAGGSVSSGEASNGVQNEHYKYTVVGPAGSNDPEVIITN